VPLPAKAFLDAYATFSLQSPFAFLVRVSAGAAEGVGFAEVNYEVTAGTYLKVRLPVGMSWLLGGNDNTIHGQIRYRAA